MTNKTVIELLDFHLRSRRSMEVFQISLAEELLHKGWRTIHVVCGEPGAYFKGELDRLNLPCIVAKFPLTFLSTYSLATQLRRFQPSVLHTAFLSKFDPFLFLLKKLARVRYLMIGDHSSGAASGKHGVKRWLARARGTLASTYIDQIVAVSDFVRSRDIQSVHLPAHKICTILNGVEIERFKTIERVEHGRLTITFVGQLIPEKGVLTFLQVVKDLASEALSQFDVLIAGEGVQSGELCRFCAENSLNHVQFLGHIDWVPKLLASADVVVIPSEWEEACAFSVIEAMACGACLLASDAGGNPELIGTDGTAGVLFERANRADLKYKLLELLSNPARRKALGTTARIRAEQSLSLRRMVHDYVNLFIRIESELQGASA